VDKRRVAAESRPVALESLPVAALHKHRVVDKRQAVRESRRVEEAGSKRAVATPAAEADSPEPLVVAVVEKEAVFRRLRRTQHWTHWSPHNVGISHRSSQSPLNTG
jgi:hypothetical protein